VHSTIFPRHLFAEFRRARPLARASDLLAKSAVLDPAGVYSLVASRPGGLTESEAARRLQRDGPNVLEAAQRFGFYRLLARAVLNPLVLLLGTLAIVSLATGDPRSAAVMLLMLILGTGLRLFQEARADRAASRLKAMIPLSATVVRDGQPREIPVSNVVLGDVVELAAGDMVPADVRLVAAKDLFLIQGTLTGESFPVEKFTSEQIPAPNSPLELRSIAFLGTNVTSGSATAVVLATGKETFMGSVAAGLTQEPPPTAFDKGISRFTWLMLRFIAILVPLVFVINGLTKGNWTEAFFFAVAVAVGLTPEMLPMIVTVCLSQGALAMSRQKVIVKRMSAIQNLGAMDVLCTDKTGTLTMDHVILEKYCDVVLRDAQDVLVLAYLNSHFQTGLRSVLDRAVLAHVETHAHARIPEYSKIDEIPFDFQRRIMSVVVRTPDKIDRLISKGAPEAIFAHCARFELDGQHYPMDHLLIDELKQEYDRLSADGFRVLAIASKDLPRTAGGNGPAPAYSKADECDLTLNGYVAFLDPPKESAARAIGALKAHGVQIKVLTGDNDRVARKICREVGLVSDNVLLGSEIEAMSDQQLAEAVAPATLFARVSPADKQRVILALQSRAHTVGFMGDGINDALALRAADVGISVDTAVDIAKEAADMILLEKSLLVLEAGVVEGRKVFANILKYVRMGASSNFGNMFSVVGASIILPFLPMTPIQILANNLLYDLGQTAIPTDNVDREQIEKPRPWNIKDLSRYILCIGPCSSLFDYTTYFIMLYVFGCWNVGTPDAAAHSAGLFQAGWFVESLVTQTLIIHVIRTNKIPFLQSCSSWPLSLMSACVLAIGLALPFTALGGYMGFRPLPPLYWPLLLLTLICYLVLTQCVKHWLQRLRWI
jgi:Mg2+-importing ATPase